MRKFFVSITGLSAGVSMNANAIANFSKKNHLLASAHCYMRDFLLTTVNTAHWYRINIDNMPVLFEFFIDTSDFVIDFTSLSMTSTKYDRR